MNIGPNPCNYLDEPTSPRGLCLSPGEKYGIVLRKLLKIQKEANGDQKKYQSGLLNEIKGQNILTEYGITKINEIFHISNHTKNHLNKEEFLHFLGQITNIHNEITEQKDETGEFAYYFSSIALHTAHLVMMMSAGDITECGDDWCVGVGGGGGGNPGGERTY